MPGRTTLALLFLLTASGCLMLPLPSRHTGGPVFSREALAFLDLPNTTRIDVLESLGEPAIEVTDPGVLVYTSETTSRVLVIPNGDLDPDAKVTVEDGGKFERVLFVGYDAHGYIIAHEVHHASNANLRSECVKWRQGVGEK
jgi:hypothetical protein